MTLRTSKILLISVSVILASCGTPGSVKVYSINADKGGFIRSQDKEVLPFGKTDGYFCESPEDFSDTVACVGGAVNVYKSKPSMNGIYRKQANDLILYTGARGYLCVSPKHMQDILDNCETKP